MMHFPPLYYMKENMPITNLYYEFQLIFGFVENAPVHLVHIESVVGSHKGMPVEYSCMVPCN